jgi:hypothetical protein
MDNTLYVSHSGQTMDLSQLEDLFSTVGDVLDTRLEINPASTKAAKMGVFKISTAQQALDCTEQFHGHMISGFLLSVKLQPPQPMVANLAVKKRKKS